MKKSGVILLLIILTIVHSGYGQGVDSERVENIKTVIQELFNGYRAGDSARVDAVFTTNAQVQTIYTSEDNLDMISKLASVDKFIKYIGAGLDEVHDERLWDISIHTDNQLATVWTQYAFFLGEKFIHCGTETFLLRKENKQWRIFYLVDTRHKTGCKLPDEIKK